MTPTFDELERHVVAARRALTAPVRAEAAAEKRHAARKRIYLNVTQHYDNDVDQIAARLRDATQPSLDAIVKEAADAAYVAEIEEGVAALEAARRSLPHLMVRACMELGLSSRDIAALIEAAESDQ